MAFRKSSLGGKWDDPGGNQSEPQPQSGKVQNVGEVGEVELDEWIVEEVERDTGDQWRLLDQRLQLDPKDAVELEILDSGAQSFDSNLDVTVAGVTARERERERETVASSLDSPLSSSSL